MSSRPLDKQERLQSTRLLLPNPPTGIPVQTKTASLLRRLAVVSLLAFTSNTITCY